VALRALPATIAIFNALQMELGIQSKIGGTIGEAYCGVVGGVKRHEYAVLGPSVNLAARLMTSPMNPGILVDNRVRMMAHRSYGFNALPPVVAKGYAEPVPIFEPLSPLERAWGTIQPNFVGRKEEILKIMGMARDMILNESPSRIVLVQSRSGMGKTTMVAHSIEHVRKLMGANKHRLVVTKKVSRDSDALVPFG
jgi:Adenylate and Guanylate cyclase catalytic domain